ncbi:MAG: hypothetical protein KJ592_00495, partial [Nanoarchaeota archaeon]|nr:hypothetical protein [Nanoarchaeota archaeon]
MKSKKMVAGMEVVLMVVAVFAFSYLIGELDVRGEVLGVRDRNGLGEIILRRILERLTRPMIPIVSAAGDYGGCCSVAVSGERCATTSEQNCDGQFADGALCDATSFCQKGCCYDSEAGVYDKNVLKSDCSVDWAKDMNCNMPGAKYGCCVLGSATAYETQGQCKVDSAMFGVGGVDWRGELNELQCALLANSEEEGACVLSGGSCKFLSLAGCLGLRGDFNGGILCTASLLNTNCVKTEQTSCVDGKDGVYFVDSCGNVANIYDSSRVNDDAYWEEVISAEDVCGDGSKTGNAKSKSCGNCNRFAGGICGSASVDNFKPDSGEFYCKDTSCMFKGESYENGESWCVYDGAIGNGDDVVGSRHWKYVCSQGVVQIEPCADYRNQICIESSIQIDGSGEGVGGSGFRNAACVANGGRMCADYNGKEGGMEECADALNCMVQRVDVADKFKFDVCVAKYPAGFDLRSDRYQETAKKTCGMASQKCTVQYIPKTWGGCKDGPNQGCLSAEFGEQMNDLCRSLGDCGGSVNVNGDFVANYKIKNSPDLSASEVARLTKMALPVRGQVAEVEDYTEWLEAAGVVSVDGGEGSEAFDTQGTAGILFAAVAVDIYGGMLITSISTGTISSVPFLPAYGGAMIGAAIGMVLGGMLAREMGLSRGGTTLMTIGGAMIGGAIGYNLLANSAFFAGMGPIGWAIIIIGAILAILGSFFGGSDCDPIIVEFECKPWQPPKGGDECSACNGDPLKPCSRYRCESLGAACQLVNVGSEEEMCESGVDDGKAPVLNPNYGVVS